MNQISQNLIHYFICSKIGRMLGKQCIARTQKSEQSTHASVMTSEDRQSIHNNASYLQQEYTSL